MSGKISQPQHFIDLLQPLRHFSFYITANIDLEKKVFNVLLFVVKLQRCIIGDLLKC